MGTRETKHPAKSILITLLAIVTIAAGIEIQQADASGTIRILPDGTVSPSGAPITTINKIVYTLTANVADPISVERSNILINGAAYTVTGDGTGNGFTLISVHDVTIENTIIRNFTYGIYAETSNSLSIRNNSLISNAYDGIGIFYSTFTSVHDNTIVRNEYDGLEVYNSSNNNIYGNYIAENVWYGMGLYEYSTGNITGNRIVGNYGGIELSLSSNNRIFHNDFINQTLHASTEFCAAKWDNDYPSAGNYWSNYDGSDIYSGPNQDQPGSDGIGDTNYTCTENNFDNYPLMNPWINLAVVDVLPSKSVVGEGYKVYINVTVQNQGWTAQTTKLRVYANTTVLATVTNLALAARSQVILNFTWQTTPALRGNYIISSMADAVPDEPDTTDNNRAYGRIVKVTIVGDVNGDNGVDILDAILISTAFSALPDSSNWNGNADINSDSSVDILDAIILSTNFGRKV